ncbi:MAG: TIGR03960 family B12-binding radical SAM protein [Myxococcales bacterium]|nr:TIGR03960 family B12-binding radical SAM protein [Myxococcales bacterium]
MTPEVISQKLDRILPRVEKPGRYTGGELNEVVKDWQQVPLRVALGFPDIYDLGMPNLGLAILYDIINKQPDMLAERVYLPWTDMQEAMREAELPLYSLESKHLVRDFDVLGLSLPYESVYSNTLSLLDLAGIPLLTAERGRDEAVVIGGGHATFNPEPMADFFDAFVIGEGEEVIVEITRAVAHWKANPDAPRAQLHRALSQIWGVYVPSLYEVRYDERDLPAEVSALADEAPLPVQKRIVRKLPPPVTDFIVPYLGVVHNRAAIEIMRGCTRGCRFCHAGMITRPVRERTVDEIVDALEVALDKTGFDEAGLLSLSSSDYDEVLPLVKKVAERFGERRLNISLPSLRIESFSVDLMDALMGNSRRSGFTLAPEAASERMREIINKPVSTENVLTTAREVFKRGWHTIKLYFMIGHPSETLDDVLEICNLARAVLAEGRAVLGRRAKVHVGVSTFVPKPHTPFQWVPCDSIEQIRKKQQLLRDNLLGPRGAGKGKGKGKGKPGGGGGIKLNWNNPHETMLEAWLTRGDRRLGKVILEAWRRGVRFDAWHEHFRFDLWLEAFEACGLDYTFYTHRERDVDEPLPWDHIDCAVNKSFLAEDYRWSLEGRTRVDCRDKCFACGILPKFKEIRRQTPGDVWECPEVGRAAVKAGLVDAPAPPA